MASTTTNEKRVEISLQKTSHNSFISIADPKIVIARQMIS